MRRWLRRFALERPEARAWAAYDWANSAFMTTVVGAVFPIYFLAVAEVDLSEKAAHSRYTLTTAAALAAIACAAPVLGTLSDVRAAKKRLLGLFAFVGAAATAGLFFVLPGDWRWALALFGLANFAAAGSIVFYDALLPHVARPGEMDRLSTSGFALGYLGGGVLLACNLLWILRPGWFGLPEGSGLDAAERTLPTRLAFLSVAVWWSVFTLPLLRRVREPARTLEPDERPGAAPLRLSFQRLAETLRDLRRYRQAFLMLLAFLVYNDGILTIIRMAALYASSRGFGRDVVVGTFLLVQLAGVPCAFLFGQLGARFGAQRMILVGLAGYGLATALAWSMTSAWHFVGLGLLVAGVQGGTQALSRSLFASLIPAYKSGEFFAFFAIGEKFAGIFGPLLYALFLEWTSIRGAVLSVLPFFIVGAWLLTRVDVASGRRAAEEAQRAVRSAGIGQPASR